MKTILAWLDWSSHCMRHSYTFPTTLCSLAWRTFFNIILLPLTYMTHLWNLFQNKRNFRLEHPTNSKIDMWNGTLIHFVIGGLGFILSFTIIERGLELNWFHLAEPILLIYIKIMGIGLLGLIAIIIPTLVIVGIVQSLIYLYKKYIYKNKYKQISIEPNINEKIYLAIKDKYCPIIDWSDVKISK